MAACIHTSWSHTYVNQRIGSAAFAADAGDDAGASYLLHCSGVCTQRQQQGRLPLECSAPPSPLTACATKPSCCLTTLTRTLMVRLHVPAYACIHSASLQSTPCTTHCPMYARTVPHSSSHCHQTMQAFPAISTYCCINR